MELICLSLNFMHEKLKACSDLYEVMWPVGGRAAVRPSLNSEPFPARPTLGKEWDHKWDVWISCCCSVVQSCLSLCRPMNCSTLGFPIIHYLSEFTQTHVHWVNDTIQPSPLPPLSPPALHLSQHQGLFQWYPVLINKIFPIHLCSMGWSLDLLRPFRKKNCICTHPHRPFAKGIRVMKNLWQVDTSKLQRVYLKKTLNRVQCFMSSPNP